MISSENRFALFGIMLALQLPYALPSLERTLHQKRYERPTLDKCQKLSNVTAP